MSMSLFIVCQFSVIACALVSGVFLTFSDFLMRSLDGARTDAGVEVMQVINRKVMGTVFMALLLGMSALAPILGVYGWIAVEGPASLVIPAAGAIYLVGVFGVTVAFNVPMNNRLATLDHANFEAAAYWEETYLPRWTAWNWVRTVASAISATLFLAACVVLAG